VRVPAAWQSEGERWKALYRSYVRRLDVTGGLTTQQKAAVVRCTSLAIIAERVREKCLSGEATVTDLDAAERALRRAEKAIEAIAEARASIWA
jgi:hypothetical protein